jgi:molecular chaperone GrpE (heat shock protein)
MSEQEAPRAAKWPFLLGDLSLIAAAGGVAWLAHSGRIPWSLPVAGIITGAVAIGAWILVTPFLRDQEAELRLTEHEGLADTLQQIQQLERVAVSIASGASNLAAGQQSLQRAEAAAGALVQQLGTERKSFAEALQRTQDQEKQTLKLELDKLRRGEEETLRVVCHLLDHNYAIYQASQRSSQPGVAQQLSQYRAACLDAVRRLGIVAHEATTGEMFNADFHQTLDGSVPSPESRISGTLACGYTVRGSMVRPIIVSVEGTTQVAPSQPVEGSNPDFDAGTPLAPENAG